MDRRYKVITTFPHGSGTLCIWFLFIIYHTCDNLSDCQTIADKVHYIDSESDFDLFLAAFVVLSLALEEANVSDWHLSKYDAHLDPIKILKLNDQALNTGVSGKYRFIMVHSWTSEYSNVFIGLKYTLKVNFVCGLPEEQKYMFSL